MRGGGCRGTSRARMALGAALAVGLLAPATAAAQDPLPVPLPGVPEPPPVPAISLPPVVPATQACPGAGRRSDGRAGRLAVGCLVNKARTRAGLPGFVWNRALARAAARHARDMTRRGYFAHQRPGGPSPGGRARAAGWRGGGVGEAIAYGCGSAATPRSVVGMWLASPPHRAILLSRRSGVGIGIAGRPPVRCDGGGATYVLDAG
jgi:uncharacterized protein YkwD